MLSPDPSLPPAAPDPVAADSAAAFRVSTGGRLDPWVRREWLLTNGLGAFASSSIVGCNTRRYHGLLCAATAPPVGRVLALSRLGETLYLDADASDDAAGGGAGAAGGGVGAARPHELGVNLFRDAVHPRGERYLAAFALWHTARWEYEVDGARVTKELLLCWRRNVAGVRYTVDAGGPAGGRPVRLDVAPFTPLREYHGSRRRTGAGFGVTADASDGRPWVVVADAAAADGSAAYNPAAGPAGGGPTAGRPNVVVLRADGGRFVRQPDWWYAHRYPIEADRGLDDYEDLFTPGRFTVAGRGRLQLTLWAAADPAELAEMTGPAGLPDWDAERRRVADARGDGALPNQPGTSKAVRRLARAADDFVVARAAPDGAPGTSVIAGYPWFADWGRDAFVSLPGLLLTTGRFEQARQVLGVFAQYIDRGMVPNRFDDRTNEPHYNTVDASLWYVHAAFEYVRLSGDRDTFERVLRPACRQIVDGYRAGTGRYNIHADTDGLITQGDPTTQLTWMDAKDGDVVFTPRHGKPVEVNALWYHALVLMGEAGLAAQVADSFRAAFWVNPFRGLADCVTDGHRDERVRPNQIFAVGLANSPLLPAQQAAVVETVRRELLTPVGLRTLARGEPGYRAAYTGPQFQRDGAYHNGTIWPWLTGAFLTAYLRVHGHTEAAQDQCREWLRPLIAHTEENCLGQVAEIFEADEPHRPVGCPAQAWSVAEVLRLAVDLGM